MSNNNRARLVALQEAVETAKTRLENQRGVRQAALQTLTAENGVQGLENAKELQDQLQDQCGAKAKTLAVAVAKLEKEYPFEW